MSILTLGATVSVPATTANLGPGFDCLGAALQLYNRFQFVLRDDAPPGTAKITAFGRDAESISCDRDNLAYRAFQHLFEHVGRPTPAVEIEIEIGYALGRGLGSSATAIVAGLLGANVLAESPLTNTQVLELAIALEGHPDNVVPAMLGGFHLAVPEGDRWEICPLTWHESVLPVVVIPDFQLSTHAARAALPERYERADAVFNIGRLGILLQGLATGRGDWIRLGMEDKLHQPYRFPLIRGVDPVIAALKAEGAYSVAISGAGATLLALCQADRTIANRMSAAAIAAWREAGVAASAFGIALDLEGARVFSPLSPSRQDT